jgi:hypothetical protein
MDMELPSFRPSIPPKRLQPMTDKKLCYVDETTWQDIDEPVVDQLTADRKTNGSADDDADADDDEPAGKNDADWLAFHKRNSDSKQTVLMKRAQKRAFKKWKTIRYYEGFSKDDCMVRRPKDMPVLDETDDGWIRYSDLPQRRYRPDYYYSHTLLPWNCIPVGQAAWNKLIHRSKYYLVDGFIRAIDEGLIVPQPIIHPTHYSYSDGNRLFSLMKFDDVDSIRQLCRQQQNDGVLSVSTEPYRRYCSNVRRLLSVFVAVPQLCLLVVGYSHDS